jgi:hypothetical protein
MAVSLLRLLPLMLGMRLQVMTTAAAARRKAADHLSG